MSKVTSIGKKPFIYIAPEGLIRCAASKVNFAEKSLKKTPNAKWVYVLEAQKLVADKLPLKAAKKVTKAQKAAKKVLRSFKKVEEESVQKNQMILDKLTKESASKAKATRSKTVKAMKKK